MGFFQNRDSAQMLIELQEVKARCELFVEKLELKMEELCTVAIAELKQLSKENSEQCNIAKRKVMSAILGQLDNINKKMMSVLNEKVEGFFQENIDCFDVGSKEYSALYALRHECSKRQMGFDEKYYFWREEVQESIKTDLEAEYQKILQEHEVIRNSFTCQQCGASIEIDRIYVIPVYLTCTHCSTKNTFTPSTKAQSLKHFARELAEQRCEHILEEYNKALRLVDKEATVLYEAYLEALFGELNSILPDFADKNNRVHQRFLEQYRRQNTIIIKTNKH